jgi:hypothetical protein
MRDSAAKEAAIAEAVRFLQSRKHWLAPTEFDWADVHLRDEMFLRLGGCLPYHYKDGLTVRVYFAPELRTNLPNHLRDFICAQLAEPKRLPRGKGRYQKGMYGPRDVAIVDAIELIHQRYGFLPIGGESQTKKPSAAAIVCIALKRIGLKLSKRRIEGIWSGGTNSPN